MKHQLQVLVDKIDDRATFEKAHKSDMGFDLTCVGVEEFVAADRWDYGSWFLRLGVRVHPPSGYAFALTVRSSFPKHGWTIANPPGCMDPEYRGEWKLQIIPWGHSQEHPREFIGKRVAQAYLVPVPTASVQFTSEFEHETERGNGGFGSTGE